MHRISLSLEMHKIAENLLERFFTTIFTTPSGGGSGPCLLTLLSPNSDQNQFSPNNIHMLPREMVMRVNKMISKEEML